MQLSRKLSGPWNIGVSNGLHATADDDIPARLSCATLYQASREMARPAKRKRTSAG